MTTVESEVGNSADTDRRQRLQRTIAELLEERQQLLVGYCRLAGISTFERRESEAKAVHPDALQRFLQLLVDYTALGHFEIYQRIIDGKERRAQVRQVAAEVYPAIAESTDFLVDFNDKYEDFDGDDELDSLAEDLSRLGQLLAVRSELEDRILEALQSSARS